MSVAGQITQAVALVAADQQPAARITQAVALVLAGPSPAGFVTQALALALATQQPAARITQAVALVLANDYPQFSTQRVQCWKITREDGEVFAYTTHNRDVDFNGVTYRRCQSVKASAVSSTANSGAQTGDVQIEGILSDAGISAEDLRSGRFDNARVEVWLVDWQTGVGRILTRGLVARSTLKDSTYQMTALTGGARMEQRPLLDVFSPLCRWEFGSSQCGVDAEALRITSTVTAASAPNLVSLARRRIFQDSARVEAVETYRNARLLWITGANAGLRAEVKEISGGVVTLWQPMAFDIAAGDTYSIIPGCSKRFAEDCVARFSNGVNFGGFPHLPGNDSLNITPDRN